MSSAGCQPARRMPSCPTSIKEPQMEPLIIVLALALLVIIILAKTALVVPQQHAYVVERLGTYSGTLEAGFHILTPFVDVIRYRLSLKEQTMDIPEQICITRD